MTDLQAAIGLAQLDKLHDFGAARRRNFAYLRDQLDSHRQFFDFAQPTPKSDPSWFGFLMTVREDAPFTRSEIVAELEGSRIQTRMLFAGNLTKHPCFDDLRQYDDRFRIVGKLEATDRLMARAFWLGVYPGMTNAQLDYVVERIASFCSSK
jgi:CDP-6-deoxy-D-xylo-4-hexulose-3-dehydrase